MPISKQLFEELEKKNTLIQEYSSSKSEMTELYQIRKNCEKYTGREMERWLLLFHLIIFSTINLDITLIFEIIFS